jgi:hypothetical protein
VRLVASHPRKHVYFIAITFQGGGNLCDMDTDAADWNGMK